MNSEPVQPARCTCTEHTIREYDEDGNLQRCDCPCCGDAAPGPRTAVADGVTVCPRCAVPGHLQDGPL